LAGLKAQEEENKNKNKNRRGSFSRMPPTISRTSSGDTIDSKYLAPEGAGRR